jgi:ubiquinone/menaquinone biosynthesis C-methylase UbiE
VREPIRAFDSAAASYDDWYLHPQGAQVLRVELAAVSRLLPPGGLGLEVGAGTGVFAHGLRSPRREIVCLDPSPEMIRRARGRGLAAVMGVGGSLPFRRGALHFAYMATVLEFLGDPVKAFSEVRAASRAGSPLVVLFINSHSEWGRFYAVLGSRGDPVFRHARLRCLGELEGLLGEAGYVVEESLGALTTGPMEPRVGTGLTAPSDACGVVAVKALPAQP